MKRTGPKAIALGGVLAALAVLIMLLGGLIPVATYVCPLLCCMILGIVVRVCGIRIAWAWYGAVSILSILLAPDKEAAAVFFFIGYYPIVKLKMDHLTLPWLWKLLLFNSAILAMYYLLMTVMGMNSLSEDFAELGKIGLIIMLLMGNFIFILLDRLLGMNFRRRKS